MARSRCVPLCGFHLHAPDTKQRPPPPSTLNTTFFVGFSEIFDFWPDPVRKGPSRALRARQSCHGNNANKSSDQLSDELAWDTWKAFVIRNRVSQGDGSPEVIQCSVTHALSLSIDRRADCLNKSDSTWPLSTGKFVEGTLAPFGSPPANYLLGSVVSAAQFWDNR